MVKHVLKVMYGRRHRHLMVITYDDQLKSKIRHDGRVYYNPEFSYTSRVTLVKDYKQLRLNIEAAKERGLKAVRNAINKKYPLRCC